MSYIVLFCVSVYLGKAMITTMNRSEFKIFRNMQNISMLRGMTPFGEIIVAKSSSHIFGLWFVVEKPSIELITGDYINCETEYSDMKINELLEAKNHSLVVCGTPIQIKTWQALYSIDRLVSYQELANLCGYPKATRAVATAVSNNPIGILIPCHRVIYKNGKIGRYLYGSDIKQKILISEQLI
ncbi:MAG: MGMT family protein [Rhabdochlamydiaceae bacterium]|nr:MGMT family protein [Candidatus Amphrikana amoebophyrae]